MQKNYNNNNENYINTNNRETSLSYSNHYLKGFYFSAFMNGNKRSNNEDFLNNGNNEKYYIEHDSDEKSTMDFRIYEFYILKKNYIIRFIDSPGYNVNTEAKSWINKIIDFLKKGMIDYNNKRNKNFDSIGLKDMTTSDHDSEYEDVFDCRVHLCLYFFTGYKTQEFDLKSMKQISTFTNIIPIIGKVSSLSSL